MPTSASDWRWAAAGALFILLATANGATYRYGGSDQAFYIPAVTAALDPASFPRDGSLIDAQGALILADEAVAAAMRATGASIETVFLAGYLLSLALPFRVITRESPAPGMAVAVPMTVSVTPFQ